MSGRRNALRTQLTLLYAVPFLLVGTILVTVPLLGVSDTVPANAPRPVEPANGLHFPVLTWSLSIAVLAVVSFALGWLVAGRFLRPLRTIITTANAISATNLHRRLEPTGRRDEFAQLARTLDELFERLETAFDAQRHFVANASHELRTPLTAERTVLQVALADPDASVESLRGACEEVLRLSVAQERLIGALLTLASGELGVDRPEPFDLAAVARGVLLSRPTADLTVATTLDAAPAWGNRRLVESLTGNLIDNALRYNEPGGRVEVLTTVVDGNAQLVVRNSGPVVPPAEVDRLFEPFQQLNTQRTRRGEGHGLGLAIVRAIANAHGAALAAHARPAGGLDVAVTFPTRHP